MITAAESGRNLIIQVEGLAPYIINPLPGFAGQKAVEIFLNVAARQLQPEALLEAWQLAVDGVDENDNTITDGPTFTRISRELRLKEQDIVVQAAFYWQSVLGIDGVNVLLEGGEGLAASKKVLELLIWTLGISPTQTERSSALETLIQSPGLTPLTPRSTTTVDMLPPSKRGFMQNRRERRAKASQQ